MGNAKPKKTAPHDEVPPPDTGATHLQVAEAEVLYCEAEQDARLKAERLIMHRKAVAMIVGLWKDREGGPVDGIDYQNQHRAAW